MQTLMNKLPWGILLHPPIKIIFCLSVCLFVYLSMSACLSMSVCLSYCLFVRQYVSLYLSQEVSLVLALSATTSWSCSRSWILLSLLALNNHSHRVTSLDIKSLQNFGWPRWPSCRVYISYLLSRGCALLRHMGRMPSSNEWYLFTWISEFIDETVITLRWFDIFCLEFIFSCILCFATRTQNV